MVGDMEPVLKPRLLSFVARRWSLVPFMGHTPTYPFRLKPHNVSYHM